MKINKAKLLVGTLAIVATAATVGSISGTVAWFQYSTRSTVSYTGASAHCTENLQIRIRSGTESDYPWKADIASADITSYLTAQSRATANSLRPVTTGAFAVATDKVPDVGDLKTNPIYQIWDTDDWHDASSEDYVLIPLELRVLDVDGAASPDYLAKNIYISNIAMQAGANVDGTNHLDLSDALRVGISAGQTGAASKTKYGTFWHGNDGAEINVAGKLDLNADGYADRVNNYDWETDKSEHLYGDVDSDGTTPLKATALGLTTVSSATPGIVDDSDPYTIVGSPIGATAADKNLEVDLLIYLEGWQELGAYKANVGGTANTDMKTIWEATKFVGSQFNFGIRFTAATHAVTGVAE